MSKISCVLRLGSISLHLYQILAGFIYLKREGKINLTIEKTSKQTLPNNMIEVVINNNYRVLYDLNDGYDNLSFPEKYPHYFDSLLDEYDYLFKRSYSPVYNSYLKNRNKVYPLGLNYMVTIPGNFAHLPNKHDSLKEKVKKVFRMVPFSEYYNGLYYINAFEDNPRYEKEPKILFMARLWDENGENLSSNKKEERKYINHQRAQCIQLCMKEFGNNFIGGITPSHYSYEKYPDLIIKDKNSTKRNKYLKLVKSSSICLSTMGLHESIGWKFAEYVAASKAIVSEKLQYEVPGDLHNGKNYLEFKTPEECINQIYKLLDNPDLRYRMMVNNQKYYNTFVRPDKLVWNSLKIVLNNGVTNIETNVNDIYTYI